MKVAVTGGNGRLGQQVVRELIEHGYAVRAVTLEPWPEAPVEQAQADITDFAQVKAALTGCDAVIHLAAITGPIPHREPEIVQTNVAGTYHVMLAAGQLGIKRAAHASSDCAFGLAFNTEEFIPDYLPLDEEHPSRPDNSYGLSKVLGERAARGLAQRFAMSIAGLRITQLILPETFKLWGGGARSPWFHSPVGGPFNLWAYLDTRDAATAFRLAIEHDLGGYELFCVTAEHTRSVFPSRELIDRFFPLVPLRAPFTGHETLQSIAKIQRVLGFVPRYRWQETLVE